MNDLRYRLYRYYRIALRKIRTAIDGPKQHPVHVRAVHYFSDGWALNFWQILDPRKLDTDFRQIIGDGFNTIILVIPWSGFQKDPYKPEYDTFYIKQLDRVMAAADRHTLSVIVRVGYSHQIPEHAALSGLTQAQRLLTNPDLHELWLQYLARVHDICSGYHCFRYGFLSWEEFWHAFPRWQRYRPLLRKKRARDTGYNRYMVDRGMPVPGIIPEADTPEHEYFHAFTNHRIAQMYKQASSVFPSLTMEVRVDKDKLIDANGEINWLTNDGYTHLESTRLTYWAPFMGAANEGEQLSAERAAELLAYMLEEVSQQGAYQNHIIDQFNFVDDAPKFRGVHADIDTGQVAKFLTLAAPLLASKSAGYGLWAFRDYRQNLLYNAAFRMGIQGWQHSDRGCKIVRNGGIQIAPGAILRQYLPARIAGLQVAKAFDQLAFRVEAGPATDPKHSLSVKINSRAWQALQAIQENNEFTLDIDVDYGIVLEDGIVIELRNDGPTLTLNSLSLYHYIFRGDIRRENGEPSLHHSAIVQLNHELAALTEQTSAAPD
jgi:hypothetical protein